MLRLAGKYPALVFYDRPELLFLLTQHKLYIFLQRHQLNQFGLESGLKSVIGPPYPQYQNPLSPLGLRLYTCNRFLSWAIQQFPWPYGTKLTHWFSDLFLSGPRRASKDELLGAVTSPLTSIVCLKDLSNKKSII